MIETIAHGLRICLIEDDPIMGESLCERFRLEGCDVQWYRTGEEGHTAIISDSFDVILSDIRLPDINGDELFRRLRRQPAISMPPVIFMTGYGSIESAVSLLKQGALDYLTKPLDIDELIEKLVQLTPESRDPDQAMAHGALGISAAVKKIEQRLEKLVRHREAPVLIKGETGVGKEVLATRLHALDPQNGPFIGVNCAAISPQLLESELFGHVKGAYTGAVTSHRGFFEQANGGTLFLDEIGEMPLDMQPKLLRVLQDSVVSPVGGESHQQIDIRLICASNSDLRQRVLDGTFREDLYYRINVIELDLPPLRERPEDILWLAAGFLEDYHREHPQRRMELSPEARMALIEYSWPGNVRELKHTLMRACILSHGDIIGRAQLFSRTEPAETEKSLGEALDAQERRLILSALGANEWRMVDTARQLGISRKTLWQKMKQLKIRKPEKRGR